MTMPAISMTEPVTKLDKGLDLDGSANGIILDADADTSIFASTDDQIDIEIAGAVDFRLVANILRALSGSSIETNTINETTAGSGVTIDGTLVKDGAVTTTGENTPTGGIGAAGGFSNPVVFHSGGIGATSATMGTDTTPVTTETYIVEVFVPVNATLTGVSLLNGSAAAGNIRISLADSTGAPIAAALTASTAQSGTAAFQKIPFAVAYAAKGPAKYFILVQFNNTSARFRSHAVGNFGASKKTGETFGTFTAVTPPTTFTADLGPVADVY